MQCCGRRVILRTLFCSTQILVSIILIDVSSVQWLGFLSLIQMEPDVYGLQICLRMEVIPYIRIGISERQLLAMPAEPSCSGGGGLTGAS